VAVCGVAGTPLKSAITASTAPEISKIAPTQMPNQLV
jgi:hypothetical protein